MKILKNILKIVLTLITIVFISALFVSKEYNYEQSIGINSPIDNVWQYTNSLNRIELWSPWNDYDPGIEKSFIGVNGSVGAQVS